MEKIQSADFLNIIPKSLKTALTMLEKAGFPSYIVGGACRDFLLGKAPHDFDVCTKATPKQMREVFTGPYKVSPTGEQYGTMTIQEKIIESNDGGIHSISNSATYGEPYEITTFRGDHYRGLDHTDCEVTFSDNVVDDLIRRDFTCNAIIYSVAEESFIDHFNGVADISAGVIKSINPKYGESFRQDPLRILRAFRFMSTMSDKKAFQISAEDVEFIKRNAALLTYVSSERVHDELIKLLLGDFVKDTLQLMFDVGVLDVILPEVSMMGRLQQNNFFHYDYWNHNLTLLDHVLSVVENTEKHPLSRMSALLHDIGKISTIVPKPDGTFSFYTHPDVGAEMADKILHRLRFSNSDREFIVKMVKYHDTPVTDKYILNRKLVKKMLNVFNGNLDALKHYVSLKTADIIAHHPYQGKNALFKEAINGFMPMVKDIIEKEEAFKITDLKVNGTDVIAITNYKGKDVGATLTALFEAVISDVIPNTRDAEMQFIKEYYESKL